MIVPWLSLFDFSSVRANFKKPIDIASAESKNYNFAILIPIFNDTKYLTSLDFLKKYSRHVILCTTTNESESFNSALKEIATKYKFRINYTQVGINSQNPDAVYTKTLLAHEAVIKDVVSKINEEYVIPIDGDTFVDGELETLAGIMDDYKFDIASVRVLPTKRTNLIEKLQGVEYDIAMQSRLIYPWATSGAGMVARRKVMIDIMENHTLFFNGGDIEIGRIADLMGYKIGYIPMVFYTDIPNTVKGWIKQRFSWMCGCFRHSIINWHHGLKHPLYFIYFTFIIYFLFPLKLFEMVKYWYYLPLLLLMYSVITYFANWKVRSKYMFLFPIYGLFQIIILLWCGIYQYFKTVFKTEKIGLIKIYKNGKELGLAHKINLTYNYAVAAVSLILIMLVSTNFTQRLILGRTYEVNELITIGKEFTEKNTKLALIKAKIVKNPEENFDASKNNITSYFFNF